MRPSSKPRGGTETMNAMQSISSPNAGKRVVILGGSGAIGSAVAEVLLQQGAEVHLAGRSKARLLEAAERVSFAGSRPQVLRVDVLDPEALERCATELADKHGPVDIVVNATGFIHDQGTGLADLGVETFLRDVEVFLASAFNVAKSFAPAMGGDRPGVFISVVAPAARMAISGHLAHIVGCAAVEAFSKALAAELGDRNIRSVCLRTHAISDAIAAGSHTRELFEPKARALGLTVSQWLNGAAQGTMTKRLPTLVEVAETIAFIASSSCAAMTGTVVNMTGGATLD